MEPYVGTFLGLKDLARELGISTRSVRRLWRRVGVPPTIRQRACHRWSRPDADKLIARWRGEAVNPTPTHA
jgi:hypothetical protein